MLLSPAVPLLPPHLRARPQPLHAHSAQHSLLLPVPTVQRKVISDVVSVWYGMGGLITLTMSFVALSAPAASNTLTMPRWPLLAARLRAVAPIYHIIRRLEHNSISNGQMNNIYSVLRCESCSLSQKQLDHIEMTVTSSIDKCSISILYTYSTHHPPCRMHQW